MDILQELPVEQWPILQDKLKQLWPLNVPGYYTLHVNLKYPKLREAFKLKVYCPYGDMDNGFVAINVKNCQDVAIFSITTDTSKIEEALLKTKLIDWTVMVNFDLVSSLTLKALERVRATMMFEMFNVGTCKMYHLAGTTEPSLKFTLPENTLLSSVQHKHIKQIDDSWPYQYPSSDAYFTTLADNGLSYGLYSCNRDELLAWIFINEYNFLCHLYCEEKYRRRGYAQYLMQCAVNELLKDGHDVYAYVVDGNQKPLAIFTKFGFKAVDDAAFLNAEKPMNTFQDVKYVCM